MKKSASPSRTRRNLALIILLAVLCVGAVELAACSFFAPAVYEQITAPVRQGAQTAALACGRAAAALSQGPILLPKQAINAVTIAIAERPHS